MAKGEYRGVANVARRVTKEYRGVNNVARNVVKAYRGVANVAREYFHSAALYFRFSTAPYMSESCPVTVQDWFAGINGDGELELSLTTKNTGSGTEDRAEISATLYGDIAGKTVSITGVMSKHNLHTTAVVWCVEDSGDIDYEGLFTSSSKTFSFTASENASHISFLLSSGATRTVTETFTVSSLTVGDTVVI